MPLANPFSPLADVDPGILFPAIADARPATIALVLSRLPGSVATALAGKLQADLRSGVLRCLADQEYCASEILIDVAETMTERVREIEKTHGSARAAQILRECEPAVESILLQTLDQQDAELSGWIRESLLTFDDIAWFGDEKIRTLIKNVNVNTWALALQRCRGSIKEKVTRNLSANSMAKLDDELDYLGSAGDQEINDAQQRIVTVARRLQARQASSCI